MSAAETSTELLLRVRGTVQGVGFRPFVHRTATGLGLRGWVLNDPLGVLVRVAGETAAVDQFLGALRQQAPPAAVVRSVEPAARTAELPPVGAVFAILASDQPDVGVEAAVPPDLALCSHCRGELFDATDRRHRYPFVNCTQCGPRYSIITALPYDRPATTMRAFRQCPACQREYDDPDDRRFHAQPNACPTCGPRLVLTRPGGDTLATGDAALLAAAGWLERGAVVAVQGLGGYHLMVDATQPGAVATLRFRKHREEKPFAVMFRSLEDVRAVAEVSLHAEARLTSAAAPIVLVPHRPGSPLAAGIAPGNPWLGACLAATPLHALLLAALPGPVVATSANLSEEPLCTEPAEAHTRLAAIADVFLEHDRPIAHPVDDSVLRCAATGPVFLRRARGYAPAPLPLPAALAGHWLCVGAQLKNVVGVAAGDRLVLSPHLGDLTGAATFAVFRRTTEMLSALHRQPFSAVACDRHPDYASTRHARSLGLPCTPVQHHLAHVLACLLEHGHSADGVLGVAFDGTGYGEDGTVWGGEFLLLEKGVAHRFGRLRPFRLAGGEAAVRDPRRVALGLVHELADARFTTLAHRLGVSTDDSAVLRLMLSRGLNSPVCSSAGRLFDAVGALLGLGRVNRFEGQTPLAVEAVAVSASRSLPLALPVRDAPARAGAHCEVDWQPLVERLLAADAPAEAPALAAGFHAALAEAITAVARRAAVGTVALSGGCFQNVLLLERTVAALHAAGFSVLTHRELPPNDGNIAAGQALAALWGLTSVRLP